MRISLLAAIVLSLSVSSGCASIVSDTNYPVTVDSNPTGANLTIEDGSGNTIHRGTAPVSLNLEASDGYFSPAEYTVNATLPDHEPGRTTVRAGLDGWYVGNIVFGGLPGWLFVDPLTGAMWNLDERVVVNLGQTETARED